MPPPTDVLGPADVAEIADAPKRPAKPRVPQPEMDILRNWLASSDAIDVRIQDAIAQAYGGDVTTARVRTVLQYLRADPRFIVETIGVEIVVSLSGRNSDDAEETDDAIADQQMAAEEAAEREATAQAAEALPDAVEQPRTIGEAVLSAAAEAGEREAEAKDELAQALAELEIRRAHEKRIQEAQARLLELETEHERCKRIASQAKANVDEQREFLCALIQTDPLSDEPRAGQQTLDDAGVPTDGSAPADAKGKAWGLDRIGLRVANSDWWGMEAAGLSAEQLATAALSQTASTGKPYKVKPVALAPQEGQDAEPYVLTAVQHAGKVPVAVLIRLHPIGIWPWPEAKPLDVPNQDRPEPLARLGRWAGIPCKVGRKRFALGSDADAILIALPQEADAPLQKALSGAATDDAGDSDGDDAE